VKSILTLLRAHLEGTIGREDRQELNEWIEVSEENRSFFRDINDPDKMLVSLRKMKGYDEAKVWGIISEGRKDSKQPSGSGKRIPLLRQRWVRYAAAVVLLLGAGVYYRTLVHKKQPVGSLAFQNDVLPGGTKAILTLANGQKVVLDSAAGGTIAYQGNASVDKVTGGVLDYRQLNGKPPAVLFNTLTTPRGAQYRLRLSDGTQVWLDAASSITYPTAFTGSERRVSITGQAYLEIAHNSSRPFIAAVNGMEIKDIGTAFNVNAYTDEVTDKVTLVTGGVSIDMNGKKTVLRPGQQLQVTTGNGQVVGDADLDEALAWKNGKFLFGEKADIATIMRQLSRWYDVDVRYEGQVRAHFGGSMSRQVNVSEVLEKLEMTGAVKFRIEGKTIIVMP
jgi:transmembrane sensor